MSLPSIFDHPLSPVKVVEGVTRASFDAEIRSAGQPVIMKGLVKSWPAVIDASRSINDAANHLKDLDVGVSVPTFIAPPHVHGRYFYTDDMSRFNFESRQVPFRSILDKLLEQQNETAPLGIYAGASPTVQTLPRFAEINPMTLVDAQTIPKVWVGNSSKVAPHFDVSENIACVVSGKRRFVIFPPDQIGNLYVGPIDYNMAGQPASLVDINAIDLAKYPRFDAAAQSAMVADLEPGDAVYLPSLWWHYVESTGPLNILVNYWFDHLKHGSPMNVLALALLVMRDLPQNDRSAWQEVFQHYIFGDDAPTAVEHIPPRFRGVLDQPSQERDHKVKTFLRTQLPNVLR
ncbi:MAG: cupin-like domain-containing protein [Pseudomonadota bacterium]